MAREQARWRFRRADARDGRAGAGARRCTKLTGYPPFEGHDAEHRCSCCSKQPCAGSSRIAAVPADLEAICPASALLKNPAQRYPRRALADDLGRFLEGRAVSVRKLNVFQRTTHWARARTEGGDRSGFAAAVLVVGLATQSGSGVGTSSASEARQINRFLNEDVLAAADPSLKPGQDLGP